VRLGAPLIRNKYFRDGAPRRTLCALLRRLPPENRLALSLADEIGFRNPANTTKIQNPIPAKIASIAFSKRSRHRQDGRGTHALFR